MFPFSSSSSQRSRKLSASFDGFLALDLEVVFFAVALVGALF
jgi:hypothetical protein